MSGGVWRYGLGLLVLLVGSGLLIWRGSFAGQGPASGTALPMRSVGEGGGSEAEEPAGPAGGEDGALGAPSVTNRLAGDGVVVEVLPGDSGASFAPGADLPAALNGLAERVVVLLPGDPLPAEGAAPAVRLDPEGVLWIERPAPVSQGPVQKPWQTAVLRVPSVDPAGWGPAARSRWLGLLRKWTRGDAGRWEVADPALAERWLHLSRWGR